MPTPEGCGHEPEVAEVKRAAALSPPMGSPGGDGVDRSSVVPPELQCPLSLELMVDPVMDAAGQTYERSAIESWLARGNRTDPMTGEPLAHTNLIPNVFARGMCRKYAESIA